jgi:hypothetical protein
MSLVPFQNFPETSPRKIKKTLKQDDDTRRHRRENKRHSTQKHHEQETRKNMSPKKDEWEERYSTTKGKPYYFNTATNESRWYLPEKKSPGTRRSPLTKVRSETTGEEYFVNRATGETILPQVSKTPEGVDDFIKFYSPNSVEALRLSAEEQMLNKLGIKSCKQIRIFLESSLLTEEEQVAFIEQHAKDTAQLRRLLRTEEFNCDQFRMLGELGAEVMVKLRSHVTELVKTTEPEKDEEEIECAELKQKAEAFHKRNKAISESHWRRLLRTSQTVIGNLYASLKRLGYDAFMLMWNSLPSFKQMRVAVFWFIQKGIDISFWIASNPKTAYYVLYGFITAKTYMCQAIGHLLNIVKLDPNELKIVQQIRKQCKNELDPNTLQGIGKQIYDLFRPHIDGAVIRATSGVSIHAMKAIKTLIVGGTGTAVAGGASQIVAGVAGTAVAGVASGGLGLVIPLLTVAGAAILQTAAVSALDAGTKALEESTEQLVYWNEIRNSYNKLFQLMNPLPCLKEILTITDKKNTADSTFQHKLYIRLGEMIKTDISEDVPTNETDADVEVIKESFKFCLNSRDSKKFRDAEARLAEYANLDASIIAKFSHVKYYDANTYWIQAAVYMWTLPRVKDHDKDAANGPITKFNLNEVKEKLQNESKSVLLAQSVAKLEMWKLQFDKYKIEWDKEKFDQTSTNSVDVQPIVALLSRDFEEDFTNYVASLGSQSTVIATSDFKLYLEHDEYYFKAIAVSHIFDVLKTDRSKVIHVRFPPWINGCIKSVRKTLEIEDALNDPINKQNSDQMKKLHEADRLIHWTGLVKFPYSVISQKVEQFEERRHATLEGKLENDKEIALHKERFNEFMHQAEDRINAYKEFMGRGDNDETYPRLMTLVVNPLNYFQTEMEKPDQTVTKKREIMKIAKSVIDRMSAPNRQRQLDSKYLMPTREYVIEQNKSRPSQFHHLIIAALYLQSLEMSIYGESLIQERVGRDVVLRDALWDPNANIQHLQKIFNIKGDDFNLLDHKHESLVNQELVNPYYNYFTCQLTKKDECTILKSITQYTITNANIKFILVGSEQIQPGGYPVIIESMTNKGIRSLGKILLGIDDFRPGVINTTPWRLSNNPIFTAYNQDTSFFAQPNNLTIPEIFDKLNFPPPTIHPDHWAKYYKLDKETGAESMKRLNNANYFARHENPNSQTYFVIGLLLNGKTFAKNAAEISDHLRATHAGLEYMSDDQIVKQLQNDLSSKMSKQSQKALFG